MLNQIFALLGTGRTGSNYLCSALNNMEGVVCHKEIYHKANCYHIFKNQGLLASVYERDNNPDAYLENLEKLTERMNPGVKVMGFKVFYNHSTACWEKKSEKTE